MRRPGLLLLAVGFSLASVPAFAQEETKLQSRGFPIGEKSRLHTFVGLGVGYDSNPDRLSETLERSDWKGAVRPGFSVDVPGNTVAFDLGAKLSLERYFGTDAAADTVVGGDVSLGFKAGSGSSPVTLDIRDVVARTPTFFSEVGTAGATERRFKQWSNRGTAALTFRPGGGALEIRTAYGNTLEFYDNLADSQLHGILLEGKLKFLPKTAAVIAADMSFFSADDIATRDSLPYNITIGLQGQITSRLSTLLRVGFGDSLIFSNGFFNDVETNQLRTVVAHASLTYHLFERSTVTVGYRRHITPVILLSSYQGDEVNGRLKIGVGPRLIFDLFGKYEHRNFAEVDGVDRTAGLVTVDSRIEYWFFDWLNAGLSYQLLKQDSDDVGPSLLLETYTRHAVMLNVGFRY